MEKGDKIKVVTHNGSKLCVIDEIDEKTVHFTSRTLALRVNKERIHHLIPKTWRGAKFEYTSFN